MRNHFLSVYLHDNIDMVTEHFKLQINFISFIKKKGQQKIKRNKNLSEFCFLYKITQIKKNLKKL